MKPTSAPSEKLGLNCGGEDWPIQPGVKCQVYCKDCIFYLTSHVAYNLSVVSECSTCSMCRILESIIEITFDIITLTPLRLWYQRG